MEVIEVEGAEGLKITIGTPVAASRPWASAVAGLYCLKIQIKHFEILFYFFVFILYITSRQQIMNSEYTNFFRDFEQG